MDKKVGLNGATVLENPQRLLEHSDADVYR
jgi:hypothetical protein